MAVMVDVAIVVAVVQTVEFAATIGFERGGLIGFAGQQIVGNVFRLRRLGFTIAAANGGGLPTASLGILAVGSGFTPRAETPTIDDRRHL